MAKKKPQKSQRRPARPAQAEEIVLNPTPGGPPAERADLRMITWLLHPKRLASLQRRMINGTAGDIELVFWDIYSDAQDAAAKPDHMRHMTLTQVLAGAGNKPGPRYLNAPPGEATDPPPPPPKGWGKIDATIIAAVTQLIEDPKYLQALERRITNGSASGLHRYFWRLPSRKPPDRDVHPRLPLCFIGETVPWLNDRLAERAQRMIEAQEAEEQRQRTEAAPSAPYPDVDDPPDPNELQLVR